MLQLVALLAEPVQQQVGGCRCEWVIGRVPGCEARYVTGQAAVAC